MDFTETFTITSPAGNVSGSKKLTAATGTRSLCEPKGAVSTRTFSASYNAVIEGTPQRYTDQGDTRVSVEDMSAGGGAASFSETFTSSLPATVPEVVVPGPQPGCDTTGDGMGDDRCEQGDDSSREPRID